MKTFIYLLFFIGFFMIIHGIYEEKFERLRKDVKIQYKFIPRTQYDDLLFESQFKPKYQNMFDTNSDRRSAAKPIR